MLPGSKPTPQQVRDWMRAPERKRAPPPDPKDIRRELGWEMLRPMKQSREGR